MYCTFLGILEHAWGEGEISPPSFASSVLKLPIFPQTPTQPSPTVHVFWVCSAVAPLFFTAIFCHDGRSLPSLFLLLLFWENRLWLQKRRRKRHEITLRRGNQHWHQKATCFHCLKQSFFIKKFIRFGVLCGGKVKQLGIDPQFRFVESVFDWVMHSIFNPPPSSTRLAMGPPPPLPPPPFAAIQVKPKPEKLLFGRGRGRRGAKPVLFPPLDNSLFRIFFRAINCSVALPLPLLRRKIRRPTKTLSPPFREKER